MSSRLLFFFLALIAVNHALRTVTINKCCFMNQFLSKEGNYTCRNERRTPWTLTKIYSFRNQSYLKQNEIPSNWNVRDNTIPGCQDNFEPRAMHYVPGSYIAFLNGSLLAVEYNRLIHPSKYCIDHNIALVCPEEIIQALPQVSVKKCCGYGGIYSETNRSCIAMNTKDYKIKLPNDLGFASGFPECDNGMVIAGKFDVSDLGSDGGLMLKDTNVVLPAGGFCLEHVLENAASSPSVITCRSEKSHDVIKEPRPNDLRFTLYPIGLALSAVFLALTLVAGSLLPASHHVLHWRCQTNHVACLLIGNVILCIVQLSGDIRQSKACFLMAVAMHFLFLSAFFWLNTMCFNIWWTFRDLRPQSLEKSQERWRLRIYEMYAWGVPLFISGTAAIIDMVEETDCLIQPGFTKSSCWFSGNREILTYFFGPIGFLLAVNLVLFAATARELTCGLWKRELVKSTSERAALGRVCMKLVVVMGVTWIADVVSWAVGGPKEIWYIVDIFNSLQGVFIFIVVGLQPQVLVSIKRLWCFRKNRAAETAGTTNHHSSSSQGMPSMGDTLTGNSITNGTKSIPLETSC